MADVNEKTSRVFAKREREHQVGIQSETFWNELVSCIDITVTQLNDYWQKELTQSQNGPNTRRIEAPNQQRNNPGSESFRTFTPRLEIRLDPQKHIVFTKVDEVDHYVEKLTKQTKERSWPIRWDLERKTLYFQGPGGKTYAALALVEYLIAEDLLGMDLDE